MKRGRKPAGRKTVPLATRLDPWVDFRLRKYAEFHHYPISMTIALAVNSLTYGLPRRIIDKWLREFRKSGGD